MKYVLVLGDGMADDPVPALGGKTPMEYASTPCLDALASAGTCGKVLSVPKGFTPGSDVANLSVLGYPPERFYSGRSPLEALSIGVDLKEGDVALRCNLVTIEEREGVKYMVDYSAGEISTEEAGKLVKTLAEAFASETLALYAGVSYRHCLVWKGGTTATKLTPPHNITGKPIAEYLPQGEGAEMLRSLISRSEAILKDHPVNRARVAAGKRPATHVWLWGAGTKPALEPFESRYGIKGAVVSAVDLLKGIAKGTGMACPDVEGATGTLDTNFVGKRDAALAALDDGADFVYIHLEAPDECGHQRDPLGKVKAIEAVDRMARWMQEGLEARKEDYVIAVLPDHETPLCTGAHRAGAVPYLIYRKGDNGNSGLKYNEKDTQKGEYLSSGEEILRKMLERGRK